MLDILLTDSNGNTSKRTENMNWLLSLVSTYLENGEHITITTDGGDISVTRKQTKKEIVQTFLLAADKKRWRICHLRVALRKEYGYIGDSTIRAALTQLGAQRSSKLRGKSSYWILPD